MKLIFPVLQKQLRVVERSFQQAPEIRLGTIEPWKPWLWNILLQKHKWFNPFFAHINLIFLMTGVDDESSECRIRSELFSIKIVLCLKVYESKS